MVDHSSQNPPPLSDHESRLFNHMADTMQSLVSIMSVTASETRTNHDLPPQHQWFRVQWNVIYGVAESSERPTSMSIKGYLKLCLKFCQNLETHHQIDEV